jgi:DNA invertase Pin-like site-specific DNA recombinase
VQAHAPVAQFEQAILKERQAEGIAIARAKGLHQGPQAHGGAAAEVRELAVKGTPKVEVARAYGVSRESLYQYVRA